MRAELLAVLAHLRVGTAEAMTQVLDTDSVPYVRRALRQLAREGLVDHGRLDRRNVWHLTRAGRAAVEDAGLVDARPHASTGARAVAAGLAAHALLVADIALAHVAQGRSALDAWRVEVSHSIAAIDLHLITDAVVTRSDGTAWMIEADRATMPVPRLVAKLRAYAAYYEHRVPDTRHPRGSIGYHDGIAFWRRRYPGHQPPPLLLVLDGAPAPALKRRAARLTELVRADRHLSEAGLNVTAITIGDARAGVWRGIPIG